MALRPRPSRTSWGGRRSGVPGAYRGWKRKRYEHSSHRPPPPCVTSSQLVRQSWWHRPMEPEHLHGEKSGRLGAMVDRIEVSDEIGHFCFRGNKDTTTREAKVSEMSS